MKKETSPMEFRAKSDVKAVDCKNDTMMVSNGLRNPYTLLNRDEFTKSDAERKVLKDLKHKCTNNVNYGVHFNKPKSVTIKVHLVNSTNSNNFKTTYVDIVPDYVAKSIKNNKTYKVLEKSDIGKHERKEYPISHLFVNGKSINLS